MPIFVLSINQEHSDVDSISDRVRLIVFLFRFSPGAGSRIIGSLVILVLEYFEQFVVPCSEKHTKTIVIVDGKFP